jgi:hypothetical protein
MSELIKLKVERNEKFSTISLKAVEDPSLSWGAKGLQTYLISRPPAWEIRYTDLLRRSKNRATALKGLIRELKKGGYLDIDPIRGEKGKFSGTGWTIREIPIPKVQKPSRGKTAGRRNRQTENTAGSMYQEESIYQEEKTTTAPVVAAAAADEENDPIEEIIAGTKLEDFISAGVIRKAIQDYLPAAHSAHQPETPAQGILRMVTWMAAIIGDPRSNPIANPAGFLRAAAKKGMDMPAAGIRAEQVETARAENAAREKKEKEEAQKIAREVATERFSREDIQNLKAKNAPALVSRSDDEDHEIFQWVMPGGMV